MVQSTQLVKMLCISKDLNDLSAYEFFNYILQIFKKKKLYRMTGELNWIEF